MNHEVKGWIKSANAHREAMTLNSEAFIKCLNAQQCAEKILKVCQIYENGYHDFTHSLAELHASLSFSLNVSNLDLDWLSVWGVDGKYTNNDAVRACKLAEEIFHDTKQHIF